MNPYFSELPTLPKVPMELLIDQLIAIATETAGGDTGQAILPNYTPPGIYIDGVRQITTRPTKYALRPRLAEWFKDNIVSNPCSEGFHVLLPTSSYVTPHTDRTRDYALIYTLTNGGENMVTTWYQEKGYPIIRRGRLNYRVEHFDRLVELFHTNHEEWSWSIINSEVIHGHTNLTGPRVSVNMGLTSLLPLAETIEHYKLQR